MHAGRAFAAGVAGAAVMTLLGFVVRAMGMFVDFELMLGTLFLPLVYLPLGNAVWTFGLIIHLVTGGIFGLLYGLGFERLSHRSGVGMGLVFGAAHLIFGGLALAAMPAIHPLIQQRLMYPPGILLSGWGGGAFVLWVVEHLIFGAIVGGTYGPVKDAERDIGAHARPT
jgi:hypothetical protein